MRRFASAVTLLFLLCCFLSAVRAQDTPAAAKGLPATVSGRVMDGSQGVAGIPVSVIDPSSQMRRKFLVKTITDHEGWFRLTNLPPGRHSINVIAPTYVIESRAMYGEPGKSLNVLAGENVENIIIKVRRGGVITGTVRDASNQPAMTQNVRLMQIDQQGSGTPYQSQNWAMMLTDDRGIYRIYGLPAGRYKVSVGASKDEGVSGAPSYYQRTFYPGVNDEKEAKIVEVIEGGETANIDITLGRRENTFQASGRVVDAETNKPVPNVLFGYGVMPEDQKQPNGFNVGPRSDENGEFRIDGLAPNRYGVFAQSEGESEFYSDAVGFQIADADVGDLEVKVSPGGSVTGSVALENENAGRKQISRLGQLLVYAQIENNEPGMWFYPTYGKVAANNSFRVGGLRPGKVRLFVSARTERSNLSVVRVERDGVEQPDGITLAAGEHVGGIRVIVAQGTGVVSGTVKVEGGTLDDNARMYVNLQRTSPGGQAGGMGSPGSDVDSRGRFLIENLLAGEYEITLNVMQPFGPGSSRHQSTPIKKSVSVSDGARAEVTLTLDLSAAPPLPQPSPTQENTP